MGGCIPVIFDYECTKVLGNNVDYSNMEVVGDWVKIMWI